MEKTRLCVFCVFCDVQAFLTHVLMKILKPRAGKLGLGYVYILELVISRYLFTVTINAYIKNCVYPWSQLLYWRFRNHYGR